MGEKKGFGESDLLRQEICERVVTFLMVERWKTGGERLEEVAAALSGITCFARAVPVP